jgi:protein TonB
VLGLDSEGTRRRFMAGLAGTLLLHASAAAAAATNTAPFAELAREVQQSVRERSRLTVDIEIDKSRPPPPPAPTVAPEPVRAKVLPTDGVPPPPPEAAQAGRLIAQDPDPNEPLDLTGNVFVVGDAETYVGGITSSKGTAKKPVRDLNASPLGVPGGTGKGPPPPPKPDLSKPALPVSLAVIQNCGFPPEADAQQVDFAVVKLVVTVAPDGSVGDVTVLSEQPAGLGFGERAKRCATRARFTPGLDSDGKPIRKTTPPIRVNFTRAR